ncbi:hypothetical protein EJB05_18831, partial [Eragrostis curvula]
MADWSSLPSDIVNRVADRLLATNDLDYYMDLRAVCVNWRSATADPKTSPFDPRFRPRRWVMLDELSATTKICGDDDGTRLFLNVATGRFLRKSLPLLRGGRYYFVTTTPGGSVVLADREPPHAARVLNPFTGALARFMAPVPREWSLAAAVVGSSADSFTLVLASDSARKVYWADLGSRQMHRPQGRGRVRSCQMESRMLAADAGGEEDEGEVFIFTLEKSTHRIGLFKTNKIVTEAAGEGNRQVHQVTSIGNHALFVGDRCLLVDADKLPSVQPNCIYYQVDHPDDSLNNDIYVYDLNHHGRAAERIAASITFNPVFRYEDQAFSLVELLVSYTNNLPDYQLMWERIEGLKLDAAFLESFGDFAIDDDDELGVLQLWSER